MNSVNLVGRLTRDPELRYTQSGQAVVRFTLAVNRRLSKQRRAEMEANNQPTADFISCTAWGITAETISNYVQKGHRLAVNGRIQTGSYERDGRTIYTTDVIVENFDFIESASQNQMSRPSFNQDPQSSQGPTNSAYNNSYNQNSSFGSGPDDEDGFFPINNEDIPF